MPHRKAGGMILEIPKVLNWTDTETPLRLYGFYVDYLSTRLCSVLALAARKDREFSKNLLEGLRRLPDQNFIRLLTAPETFARLMFEVDDHLNSTLLFLSNSLVAEYRLIDSSDTKGAVWSALGDFYCPPDFRRTEAEACPISFTWSDGTHFRAPCLINSIPLDFNSPFVTSNVDDCISPSVSFSAEEVRSVIERLDAAVRLISQVKPNILADMTLFTKVILLLKDAASSTGFGSSSTRRYIGRTVLINPHLNGMNHVNLANALIHESIHSLLYAMELKHPLILGRPEASGLRICSPWTGKSLSLSSYLHACFVWYGLWHFWKAARTCGRLAEDVTRSFVHRSASGFTKAPLLSPLGDAVSLITPDLKSIIPLMQETVNLELH
jgi:hypothetical protein